MCSGTFPVIVTRSASASGIAAELPTIQRTRSAPGFCRATFTDACAGSTAVTCFPMLARRHANVPVPDPRSTIVCALNVVDVGQSLVSEEVRFHVALGPIGAEV